MRIITISREFGRSFAGINVMQQMQTNLLVAQKRVIEGILQRTSDGLTEPALV